MNQHGHSHERVLSAAGAHQGRLLLVAALTGLFLVVEVFVAIATNSLTVLSDAGHMTTDLVALILASLAISVAAASRFTARRTFGLYRLETLAALVNSLLLLAITIYVGISAINRFGDPVEVAGRPLIIVALAGLVINVLGLIVLRGGAKQSLAVRSAATEVLADAVGSVAILVTGIVVSITGAYWVDPVLALGLVAFMAPRAINIAWHAVRVLLQAAPQHLDINAMRARLATLDRVVDVHDLHAWTLTSGMEVVTAHLAVTPNTEIAPVLQHAREVLEKEFAVQHATLQVEPATQHSCLTVQW